MAASIAGALKAYIESLGLGVSVYRDRAPQKTARPYLEVVEAVALVPDNLEDGAAFTGKEMVQVDLWQDWKDPTGKLLESMTLPGALLRALTGCHLSTSPTTVYAVLVRNMPRLLEEDARIVHHPITLEIRRQL